MRWALAALVVGCAVAGGLLAFGGSSHDTPKANAMAASNVAAATWAAGRRPAPGFALVDQHGAPVSLAALRGRPVLVTFIDPLCRDFCPIEAQHLNAVVRSLPASQKPEIVAVSVNTAGDTDPVLREDAAKWRLTPQWHWAIGSPAALARVWHAYGIEVLVTTQKIAGVRVRRIVHTEAAYLIDAHGDERALFIWPYTAKAVLGSLRVLAA